MYISKLYIKNFKCFREFEIEFNEGLNVIIGSNNSGKTTIIKAIEYIFNRSVSKTPSIDDFNKELDDLDNPPEIIISATLRSSHNDTLEDKAIVASWLTKLESPWEATLTYKYFLPESNWKEYKDAIKKAQNDKERWGILENFLKKYVSRIYGGKIENKIRAETEYLEKIHCETLDALRDVESKMFTGRNSLLKQLLTHFIDNEPNNEKSSDSLLSSKQEFQKHSNKIVENIVGRLNRKEILRFAQNTGASIGGEPDIDGRLEEADVLSILRLIIRNETGIEIPIINNGLGYNNLIYMSLILAKFKMITSEEYGENAKTFPILLIEEPEAHLHPALQYNFLKFLKEETDKQTLSRQIFITTHSTQITSAVGLDPIICLERDNEQRVQAKYPSRVFSDSPDDQKSKGYVERFLDATKSAMLFARSVLLVEGMAELILFPVLAESVGCDLERSHVAIVRADALTFSHFIKMFGAGISPERKKYALQKRVACVIDTDPCKKPKKTEGGKKRTWKSCYPFELNQDHDNYEYKPLSGALENLKEIAENCANVEIFYNKTGKGKTFEYDLAWENYLNPILFQDIKLEDFEPLENSNWLPEEKERARYAASYLKYADGRKGELALEIAHRLKNDKSAKLILPSHIKSAFNWVCYKE
ncbi:DUF2813 domain-containing protein [Geobacillus sp. NFOSA3]|uniref:AAA family ATPase n=1 Tax=Geobacillus sp. BMUD TaxID=2508876 RepID=UPI0014917B67|nr:DUF2813 domain-containing protein [Geobacillus sp. BMUD]NNU94619.1 DUF2813 domain-containing protein [Geobacillus sp. NFOSA3]